MQLKNFLLAFSFPALLQTSTFSGTQQDDWSFYEPH
jgi:hypothetical protein